MNLQNQRARFQNRRQVEIKNIRYGYIIEHQTNSISM